MKNLLFAVITIFTIDIISLNDIYGNDDPVQNLYSEDNWEVLAALNDIQELKIYEAINPIIELMEYKPPFIQVEMLITLYILDYKDFQSEYNHFMARAEKFDQAQSVYDTELAKAIANIIWYLYDGNDLSGFYQGYEYFNIDRGNPKFSYFIDALGQAMDSPFEDIAKTTLISIAEIHSNSNYRVKAMNILHTKYIDEFNIIKGVFLNDNEVNVRLNALNLLTKFPNEDTRDFLYQNIFQENSSTIKHEAGVYLVEKFGDPIDIKTILHLKDVETEELYISLYSIELKNFIPPPFNPDLTVLEVGAIIDSHIEDIISYNWAPKEYIEYFNLIQRFLKAPSQYNKAVDEINSFLLQVEKDYADEVITLEAYKFLKQEPEYLLEKLMRE